VHERRMVLRYEILVLGDLHSFRDDGAFLPLRLNSPTLAPEG
jgi:hypothetical protein